jgi:2-polyprenyl-3-methyl-5-hydroxy-6-metoxy-1,4-benzoquinol methylase
MSTTNAPGIVPEYHSLTRTEILPLAQKMGGTLLDVGGGVGATAALLKSSGYVEKAGVIDLVTPDTTALGLDFHHAANLENPASLQTILEVNGPFSVILCLDVLEHLVDPWSVIKRLHTMLTPNGIIIASIPNIRYYKASWPLFFLGKWELQPRGIMDKTHLRWFVKKTAKELMTHSGMRLEAIIEKPGGGRKIRIIRLLTLGIFNDFTNVQFLIRVRNVSAQKN